MGYSTQLAFLLIGVTREYIIMEPLQVTVKYVATWLLTSSNGMLSVKLYDEAVLLMIFWESLLMGLANLLELQNLSSDLVLRKKDGPTSKLSYFLLSNSEYSNSSVESENFSLDARS